MEIISASLRYFTLLLVHCFLAAAALRSSIGTDQSALLALKAHITGDPENILARNWSATISVCNWIGIRCDERQHRVTGLNLSHMGLAGTIPPHLGNLSFLSHLSLREPFSWPSTQRVSFFTWAGSRQLWREQVGRRDTVMVWVVAQT